jgi:hypothetical protein
MCEYRQSHTQLWAQTRQRGIKSEYLWFCYMSLFWLFLCFTFNFSFSLQIHAKFIGKFDRETLYRFLLLLQAERSKKRQLWHLHADGFYEAIPTFETLPHFVSQFSSLDFYEMGSHSRKHEDNYILGYDALWFGNNILTFHRNLIPPSARHLTEAAQLLHHLTNIPIKRRQIVLASDSQINN